VRIELQDQTPLPLCHTEVIRDQVEIGTDVISDGEGGFGTRDLKAGEQSSMVLRTKERLEFTDFYETIDAATDLPKLKGVCSNPIRYIGAEEIRKDLNGFRVATAEVRVQPEEAFMPSPSADWLEHFFENEHYATSAEYLIALANGMRYEYKAILDAEFLLQIDAPARPDTYDMIFLALSIAEYRRFTEIRIETLNAASRRSPEDRIRCHLCWGIRHGPHTLDLPFADIIHLMPKIRAMEKGETTGRQDSHPGRRDASQRFRGTPRISGRLIRSSRLAGRDNVIAGTDCGLRSRLHPQIAWAKLNSLTQGAQLAAEQLWQTASSAAQRM
jgi:5-methyltetrahydropteroyltriglutamate--homocysteine methyltransferase